MVGFSQWTICNNINALIAYFNDCIYNYTQTDWECYNK